uniref:Phospholipase n=1 Tax=Steinernema glaseri TaxID=37863 RepID=A0A1I7ZS77_9BILA
MTSEQKIEEQTSDFASSSDEDDGYDVTYCDCVAATLHQVLPGTPGRKGFIPYSSIYESQDDVRKRGYWIPGVPVSARITSIEKDTTSGVHLINVFLYTIELEHGPFRWKVVKRYRDFQFLSNRLMAHRAAERLRAPVRRAQSRLDNVLESVGVDIFPDEHKEDCPYYQPRSRRNSKSIVLSKTTEMESSNVCEPRVESPAELKQMEESAVQSGILDEDDSKVKKKRKRRRAARHTLPPFPYAPESMVTGHIEDRKEKLENWLQTVLHIPVNRNHHETAEFLEVSRFSFVNQLGGKYTEGFVKKRPGGARAFLGYKKWCIRHCLKWSKRWLILKDSFVFYMDPRTEEIHLVLLFDNHFGVNRPDTEINPLPREFVISNQQHVLHMKCRREQDAAVWKSIIEEQITGRIGRVWLQPQRFGSSFPTRQNSYVKWFVDGKDYMECCANMMELAREEILIADWWLSPEIYMKRPMTEGNRWRLDQILKRKAEQGVKIFILLYKEMEMALGLNSIYTKRTLQALHPNIKVMRHPDHYPSTGTFFWAHHEKLVVVDQLIAFVGGIDLCYGRWDDNRHVLTDMGSVQYSSKHFNTGGDFSMLRGMRELAAASATLSPLGLEEDEEVPIPKELSELAINNSNGDSIPVAKPAESPERAESRVSDVVDSRGLHTEKADLPTGKLDASCEITDSTYDSGKAASSTRMSLGRRISLFRLRTPKRPIPPQSMLQEAGPASEFVTSAVHKNMSLADAAKKYKEYIESGAVVEEKRRAQTPPMEKRKKGVINRAVSNLRQYRAKRRWKQVIDMDDTTGAYELGWIRLKKDAVDETDMAGSGKLWLGKDYVNFIHKDFVELDMPFHDFIDRGVTARMPWHDIHSVVFGKSARDVARHFIQRWNATKTEKLKEVDEYPYLLPKSYDSVKIPRTFMAMSEVADVQLVRSLSNWSSLIDRTEDSIQQAYLSLIANSKHFIYIENQFFVSMIDNNDVLNEICKVICARIVRAHKAKETYRVYILIPLLPGFEGDVAATTGSSLQAVLNWTYRSISRGPHSLLHNLREQGVEDPWQYVSFCSLRTHDRLNGRLITELVYIHCKLMIVDDCHTIIGSANINDRSQQGNRDSEVCIVVDDTNFVESVMDGKPYRAGKFAHSLRTQLMKEHLGLLEDVSKKNPKAAAFQYPIDVTDPVAESFYHDIWCTAAAENTRIYEEIFRVAPTDLVQSFAELKQWNSELAMAEYSASKAEERLRELRGSLVEFPIKFLLNENLSPSIASKEGLVPTSVFT